MTRLDSDDRTWILEQKKGAYRIQVDGQRAGKVVIQSPERTLLIPRSADEVGKEKKLNSGLLTRQISIYAPSQYLLCSPSRDLPLSPISLPSPTLSYSNLLEQPSQSTSYYTLESNSNKSEYRIMGKEKKMIGDFKISTQERGHWGKQKVWVDGRLLNSKGNEPLLILSVALKVLEQTNQNLN